MNPLLQLGLVATAYFAGRAFVALRNKRRAAAPFDEAAAQLRQMVLSLTADKVGAPPVDGVYGVVMDLAVGNAVASVVGLVDGTSSLYFSTGGGVLGAGAHEPVKQAAARVNLVASKLTPSFAATADFPMPTRGHVKFYLTTTSGVLTAEADESALRKPDHPLHALYAAAQDLLTAIRISSTQPKSAA